MLVVDDDPERLLFAVPAVVPGEVRLDFKMHLKNGPSDGLAADLHIKARQVA